MRKEKSVNHSKNIFAIATLTVAIPIYIVSFCAKPTIDNSIANVSIFDTVCYSVETSKECLAGPNLGPIVYFLWKFFFSDMPCGWVVLIVIAVFLIAAFGNNDNNSNSNNNSNNTTQQ